jgi:hypothetical protein
MKNISKYYEQLPPWAKGVVFVGGALVVYMVGNKLYKKVFPSAKDVANRQLLTNVNSEISKFQNKGLKPSYNDSNYITFANTIYEGMRYCVGDDYGAVEENLKKMKNDLDVAKLIKAFGQKQNYCFGIPTGGEMDLFTFVKKELGNDYGGLTDYRLQRVNSDWTKKGITYKI